MRNHVFHLFPALPNEHKPPLVKQLRAEQMPEQMTCGSVPPELADKRVDPNHQRQDGDSDDRDRRGAGRSEEAEPERQAACDLEPPRSSPCT